MACVEECISERESRKFEEGLNTKVKLDMYKRFGKSVEFKKYLHGICDAGSRLLFKFRSGTHGLNEELGRHRAVVLNLVGGTEPHKFHTCIHRTLDAKTDESADGKTP